MDGEVSFIERLDRMKDGLGMAEIELMLQTVRAMEKKAEGERTDSEELLKQISISLIDADNGEIEELLEKVDRTMANKREKRRNCLKALLQVREKENYIGNVYAINIEGKKAYLGGVKLPGVFYSIFNFPGPRPFLTQSDLAIKQCYIRPSILILCEEGVVPDTVRIGDGNFMEGSFHEYISVEAIGEPRKVNNSVKTELIPWYEKLAEEAGGVKIDSFTSAG